MFSSSFPSPSQMTGKSHLSPPQNFEGYGLSCGEFSEQTITAGAQRAAILVAPYRAILQYYRCDTILKEIMARGHSWDTFWTLRSAGPEGPQRHPEGHSRDTSGPKGPRDSCSRSGGGCNQKDQSRHLSAQTGPPRAGSVYGQNGVDLSFSPCFSCCSIWGHCSQVPVFTTILAEMMADELNFKARY